MVTSLGNYGFNFIREVSNSPIGAFSVGVEKRNDRSYRFDNRTREPMYLFQYTLSGSGTLEIDGVMHTIGEGQGFLLRFPSNTKYYFDEQGNTAPWHFIYLLLEGHGVDGYYEYVTHRCGNILSLSQSTPTVRALESLYELARAGNISDYFMGERLVFDLLCKLCSDCLPHQAQLSETVSRIIRIMETEFASLGGISDIASRLDMTQNHLCRCFILEVGVSPIEYLTRVRLQKSVNLLHQTNLSIDAIAHACGFSCGNYFCKVFRKQTGISPLKYRARASNILYDSIRI